MAALSEPWGEEMALSAMEVDESEPEEEDDNLDEEVEELNQDDNVIPQETLEGLGICAACGDFGTEGL